MARTSIASPQRARPAASSKAEALSSGTQMVECKIECAADGYGIEIESIRHRAIVRRLVGAASAAGVLKVHDRITHVDGDGPLDHRGVLKVLSARPSPVSLTVVRGEAPPPYNPRPPSSGFLSSAIWYAAVVALIATATQMATGVDLLAELGMPNLLSADPVSDGSAMAAGSVLRDEAPADLEPRKRRPGLKIGEAQFSIDPDDGSPDDPDAMRAAMRRDKEMMRSLRKNKPEWARVITGFEDGTYDRKKFVSIMKENYQASQHQEGVKQNDDGSAVDPAAFLRALKAAPGRPWLKHVKKNYRDVYDKIMPGGGAESDLEALQGFLRYEKSQREGQGDQGGAPAQPPPPPTPYDNVGDVQMSMRILTDEGEEKDLFQLMPKQSEEEKWTFPSYMQCAACEAVAFQAAKAVADRLAHKYKDDLVGTITLEALQDLCGDVQRWSSDYALVPTMKGVNTLKGPGITYEDALKDATDVMMAEQHSNEWGAKLGKECERHLLGADAPEEGDFAAMSMEATTSGIADSGAVAFRDALCAQPKQPCAEAA